MILIDGLLELLFPRKCVLCTTPLSKGETDLCHSCRKNTKEFRGSGKRIPGIDDFVAVWYYEDLARESLLRYKFGGKRSYAESYGRLLGMEVLRAEYHPDLITWVPVSSQRKWERGYDQAELLAKALGKELGIPAEPLLKKVRNNPAQSGVKDPQLRKENVRDVYILQENTGIVGKQILLVDDIVTTGATSSECAKVLRKGGAERVFLAVMAGTEKQQKHKKIP